MITRLSRYLSLAVAATLAFACSPAPAPRPVQPAPQPAPAPTPPPRPPVPTATATAILRDLSGRQVGSFTFADTYAGLLITGSVTDLGLGGHAIHLHAVGKCEPPFATAGAHFNPTNRAHGFKAPGGGHLGDLPNLDLPAAGVARFELLVTDVTLRGRNALLDADGASIIVHTTRDDYLTDPAGNSGGRIACGIIIQQQR